MERSQKYGTPDLLELKKWIENNYLKLFLLFFVIGNLFFLNSNRIFHGSSTVLEPSEFEEEITWNDRVMELIRWDYDKERSMMEIELAIEENRALDGIYHYEYLSREYNEGELAVEAVVETEDMLVIRIKNVPKNYSVLSLHLNVPHGDPEEDLVLYENRDTIRQITIEDRTVTGYMIEKLHHRETELETEIASAEQQIKDKKEAIGHGEERISRLENKMAFQVGDTKERTQNQIDDLQATIQSYESTIQETEDEIAAYKLELESLQTLIKQYQEEEKDG